MTRHGWAGALPAETALYSPLEERDACGVGFIVAIDGRQSHRVLRDASEILCRMTHRGAVGADKRDGDGAGVMSAIPHRLFAHAAQQDWLVELPPPGQYAVGNIYLNPDEQIRADTKRTFEEIAASHGLRVLFWRRVPRDSSVVGPMSRQKEPVIEQPFVVCTKVVEDHADGEQGARGTSNMSDMDAEQFEFERRLYLLRKHSTHTITMHTWFYICSLSSRNIVYKGRLSPSQVYPYFADLRNELFETHFALVHSRFSTNTFPSWDRAQPMRWCAHNGEINTLRGNKNWTRAREGQMASKAFGPDIEKLFPIIEEYGSDSAAFDNVLELLVVNGMLSLPEAVMLMIPEAWQKNETMPAERRAFYEWAACIMEPWDGPALITFADGRFVGACLDRNGLRPCRYYITEDKRMICASEVGTLPVDPKTVVAKGRLQPGRMLLVDTRAGCVVDDDLLKTQVCQRQPFAKWLTDYMIRMDSLVQFSRKVKKLQSVAFSLDARPLGEDPRMKAFGFGLEQLNMLLLPMIRDGKEALGSMGTDTPLACLSENPRLIYDYFRQLFAQVTNPPIDPIREEIVMSLSCYVGPEGNLLDMVSTQCARLHLPSPVLNLDEMYAIRCLPQFDPTWKVTTIDLTFNTNEGPSGYVAALDRLCEEVSVKIDQGFKVAILSDRLVGPSRCALSALVALGAVHHHLVRAKRRSKLALIVETGEATEVHHMCVLLGYGADAICPYLAFESVLKLKRDNVLPAELDATKLMDNYRKACNNGILKVMSKMGISTLQSYKGAQIFEALGIDTSVIQRCFAGTASRIKGVGFDLLASDALIRHNIAYNRSIGFVPGLPETGEYHWRKGGEEHINDPTTVASLQEAVRDRNREAYDQYSKNVHNQIKNCTLRGMLDFRPEAVRPIPVEEVEEWTEIVKRFCTGAMSYGSISYEAHSTLAVAMNRLGGKSNTGEGGEDPERSQKRTNGDSMRSAIKQVASGRFGVTSFYLSDADELQIKMAQGAKPGEGGELPGHKVSESIAKTRKSTAGVGLISPPPHHDIYSIEDLKQLIYDLKGSNPRARVSVKLVSEVGVGVIAAGVVKAKADHILISGHDGGTGASRWTGIKYAGLPWELGLAETHQTLVLNNLRDRVCVQTDGQIKTGRDVVLSCLLGAEEWGFATTPLIAMGCLMMRKCHLNTCPVGIATQDPYLREKFKGQPEHVVNFFYYVAQEVREIMARLGFRRISDMVGRADLLCVDPEAVHRNHKTALLDLRPLLTPARDLRPDAINHYQTPQDHALELRLDNKLIQIWNSTSEMPAEKIPIRNVDRAVGAMLSYHVSQKHGEQGMPDNALHFCFTGSAGQSFGAFLAPGITMDLEGDANDYVGKGLSGGRLAIYPPAVSPFNASDNVIVGNVCLYGATSGQAFFCGKAAERFAVRNSGAIAIVEGVGDHGCEYMTGGRVVVLGPVGRNFAAGMSGGIAYLWDPEKQSAGRCNTEMVDLDPIANEDLVDLRSLLELHLRWTGSEKAKQILAEFPRNASMFLKVFPQDLKQLLLAKKQQQQPEPPVVAFDKMQMESVDIENAVPVENLKLDRVKGFVKYPRKADPYRAPEERVNDYEEISQRLTPRELKVQASRCMDCGVPFCQSNTGCPIGNVIPKWNELVAEGQWKQALDRLLLTNNFPEFTGRVCPAPCEGSCVLGIIEKPVAIKSIECAIIDKGFEMGWMKPRVPVQRTGRKIAIIGSGPAGLAAADQLNQAGHSVTVYEKQNRIGGLLMYGIPNMKLDKKVVQRRINLMGQEGVTFVTSQEIDSTEMRQLRQENDAILLATGAAWPRDLQIPNRNLEGIHFAMTYLTASTQNVLADGGQLDPRLSAQGKRVVVIGGGDTGCDCIGTAMRQGAKSVVNFELLPEPPQERAADNPWPQYPRVFRLDYGHGEVQKLKHRDPRLFSILSTRFLSDGHGNVKGIQTQRVEWTKDPLTKQWKMSPLPNTETTIEADLVLLAMGFLGPEQDLLKAMGLTVDPKRNIIQTTGYETSSKGVFAAGDCRRGQSLVVWAINEGRMAARDIDQHLMKRPSLLPVTGGMISGQSVVHDSLVQLR